VNTASFAVRAVANSSLPAYSVSTPTTTMVAFAGADHFVPGNVTYVLTATANAALSVDGVPLATGDLVLCTQSAVASPVDAGLFRVYSPGSASTPWILASAFQNSQNSLPPGALFLVDGAGATLHNSVWSLVTAPPITIGVTACSFLQRLVPA
jgi:hypothetical protein